MNINTTCISELTSLKIEKYYNIVYIPNKNLTLHVCYVMLKDGPSCVSLLHLYFWDISEHATSFSHAVVSYVIFGGPYNTNIVGAAQNAEWLNK